jgi:hypothetical protein
VILGDPTSPGYPGRCAAYRAGFTAGYRVGAEIGAAHVLSAVQCHLPGSLIASAPQPPYSGTYKRLREIRDHVPTTPCSRDCGTCNRCNYVASRKRYTDVYRWPENSGITEEIRARIRREWNTWAEQCQPGQQRTTRERRSA